MRKLVFTCGDPAGVGPEIIEAWLRGEGRARPLGAPGTPKDFGGGPSGPSLPLDIAVIGPAKWLATLPAGVECVAVGPADYEAKPGEPTEAGARIALAAMEEAAAGCRDGRFAGVVTGPVSKAELARVGYTFPGQTEFFAARWGGEPVMAFCGGRLRVVLLTWHIPLRDVPEQLTRANFARTVRAADALVRAEGIAQPRIAVCGLNPHAGEGGLLGSEEITTIDPILDGLRGEFPGLSRALPGDTVFGRQLRGEFDAVIALYHDQGLAPLKVIDFDEAVNVTLGLPFVRTSPDHGTAFGIAGKGVASATSFANAVTVARRLITVREAN
jgi:4-hydroxythreonine-4-phosphate dehydrogenase